MKFLFPPTLCALFLLFTACTYDQVIVPETCDLPLELTVASVTPSSCGLVTGSIVVNVSGGNVANGAVSFQLGDATAQTSPEFSGLTAGAYVLTATQGACSTSLEFTVDNAVGLNATAMVLPSGCTSPSGQIEVGTTDAIGVVNYSLDGGPVQTNNVFTQLSPGEYEITATDESGCTVTLTAKIVSDVAFAQVETIVANSCAVSGCHAGNVSPDFRNPQTILDRAERIRSRTGNRSMPPSSSGRSLSDTQIDAIACWVADGAPE
ncbi:MAG: hypothetical protein AAFN92_16875 [Bacteroidota bacterium]